MIRVIRRLRDLLDVDTPIIGKYLKAKEDGTFGWESSDGVLPSTITPNTILAGGSGSVGTSSKFAREDHVHPLTADTTPTDEDVGSTSLVGTSSSVARADHRHAMPGLANTESSGFLSSTDKTKLDNATASNTPNTLMLRDNNGRAQVSDPSAGLDIVNFQTLESYIDNYEPALGNPDVDGKVLSSTAAGVRTWITPAATSNLDFIEYPRIPPANPSIYDDEFDTPTLSSKWTVFDNSAAEVVHHNLWPSHVRVRFSGDQKYSIKQDFVPGGDFSVTACARISFQENYQGAKLCISSEDEMNGVLAVAEYSALPRLQLGTIDNGGYTWNRIYITGLPYTGPFYIHLQRMGNNWLAAISYDGFTFWRLPSTYTKAFTVGKMRLHLEQNGSAMPRVCGWDWVRVNWVTL